VTFGVDRTKIRHDMKEKTEGEQCEKTEGEQCDDSKNETSRCGASATLEDDEKPRSADESRRGEMTQAGGMATSPDHDRAAKPDAKSTRGWKQRRPIPNTSQTRRMGGGNKGRMSYHGGSEIGDSRADHGRQHPHIDDKVNVRSSESACRQDLPNCKDGDERSETDKQENGAGEFEVGTLASPGLTETDFATEASSFALALPNLERDQRDPQSLVGAWRIVEGAFYRLTPTTRRSGPERGSFGEESDDEDRDNGNFERVGAAVEGDPQQTITLADGTLVEEIDLVEGKADQSRRRRIVRLGALVLLTVVIVTVAVAVGVTLSSRRGPEANPPTSTPTLAPTFAPKPITEAMVEAFQNVSRLSNATLSAMRVDGSPQFKAFQWLTSTDHPAIPDDSDPVQRMVQQFALAVLYYATNTTNATSGSGSTGGWKNALGWLTDPDECQWFGCSCLRTEQATWELSRLDLSNNGLGAATIPIEVGLLTSLQALSLTSNAFSGTIPSQLYQATGLTLLDLDNNLLNGTISPLVGKLLRLTSLNLWTNEDLTGSLPTQLGLLTLISDLTMFSMLFTGPRLSGKLPSELGNLKALTSMTLSGYQFSGTIPTELAKLTLLDYLSLYRNELSGSIPTQLGRLTKLGELDVRDNAGLTGTVPESLCAMINSNRELVVRVTCDVVTCSESCGCTCE
jgi:hypothetical protein